MAQKFVLILTNLHTNDKTFIWLGNDKHYAQFYSLVKNVKKQPEVLPASSKSIFPRCRTPATTRNRSSFSSSSKPIFFMAVHILIKSPWSSNRGSFREPALTYYKARGYQLTGLYVIQVNYKLQQKVC